MSRVSWSVIIGLFFLGTSSLLYAIHYMIFGDAPYLIDSLLLQLAFLPIYLFLTTLIIDKLLSQREKSILLRKLNMVIGAFFSEVGNELVGLLLGLNEQAEEIRGRMQIEESWLKRDFAAAKKYPRHLDYQVKKDRGKIIYLKEFLEQKRGFMLRLLQNPNLLEHETFTNLLWAVFHLTEELKQRRDIYSITDSDLEHLTGDVKRVYTLLLIEWLDYMEHLREDYPYLYSLEVRMNPFNPKANSEFQ